MVNLNKKGTTVESDTSWFWDNSAVKNWCFCCFVYYSVCCIDICKQSCI